jgi:chemotaxis signal transduction protein
VSAPAFLVARVGADRYGIELAAVRQVVPLAQVTRVPTRSHAVRGVIPYQERYLSVVSLEALITGRVPPSRDSGTAVVVRLGGTDLALEVDDVESLVDPGAAYLAAAPAGTVPARGVCRCEGALVTVLDTATLEERVTTLGERAS